VALRPQTFGQQQRSSLEQPPGPSWGSRFFSDIQAAFSAIFTSIGRAVTWIAESIAKRWRGILLTHLFVLTVWLAVQAFLYAKDAYTYLRERGPTFGVARLTSPSAGSSAGASANPTTKPSTGSSTSPSGSSPAAKVAPYRPVTCWRDRSLDGNCFVQAEPRRKPPPPRARIYERFPCHRVYNCWPHDI